MRVLIVGCGSIGSVLADACEGMKEIEQFYLADKNDQRALAKAKTFAKAKAIACTVEALQEVLDQVGLVIEAASQDSARQLAPMCLERGKDVMLMSAGALVDDEFREECFVLARSRGGRLFVPSGAVCGTDGLHSASAGQIDEVRLITTKGPDSWKGVQCLIDRGVDVAKLKKPEVLYDGPAREAIRLFPKNINVAATVSMLGLGFERTKVTLICDPSTKTNSHVLVVKGPFGEIRAETSNAPFPSNPATSFLAALSAVAALKSIASNVWIGV